MELGRTEGTNEKVVDISGAAGACARMNDD